MKQMEQNGGDMSGLLESMMQQLLSKEVLYQPLSEMGAKYPTWLEANKDSLSTKDLDRWECQFAVNRSFSRLMQHLPLLCGDLLVYANEKIYHGFINN